MSYLIRVNSQWERQQQQSTLGGSELSPNRIGGLHPGDGVVMDIGETEKTSLELAMKCGWQKQKKATTIYLKCPLWVDNKKVAVQHAPNLYIHRRVSQWIWSSAVKDLPMLVAWKKTRGLKTNTLFRWERTRLQVIIASHRIDTWLAIFAYMYNS